MQLKVFASPRVFSLIGYKTLKKRLEGLDLVINRNDIVSEVPFIWLGYLHYGFKTKLGKYKITFPWNWYDEHMNYMYLF